MHPLVRPRDTDTRALHVYLLGMVDYDALLALQRRLVYDVSGERSTAALILCEHGPQITVGRQGSAAHIHFSADELHARRCPIRWINRGGGCLLHLPGQVVAYPIVAINALQMNLQEYLDRLHRWMLQVLRGLDVPATTSVERPGIWVADRMVAHVGIAMRDWVSYHGLTLNVDPNLEPFRRIACDGHPRAMTSIERELRVPIRPASVRYRLVEGFAAEFGFDRVSVFHHHPVLPQKVAGHAAVTRPA